MISRSKLHNETAAVAIHSGGSDHFQIQLHRVIMLSRAEVKTGEVKRRQIINDGLPGCSIQKPGLAANGDSAEAEN